MVEAIEAIEDENGQQDSLGPPRCGDADEDESPPKT
jgi:hypothetical protein